MGCKNKLHGLLSLIFIVYQQTGRPHGQLIREQMSGEGGGALGGGMRFPNCLVLWVKCEQATLDARCDRRVDQMMSRGLLTELEDFHKVRNERNNFLCME